MTAIKDRKTTPVAETSSRKIVGLIAIGLTIGLGWVMISQWLGRMSTPESRSHSTQSTEQHKEPSTIANSAWSSAATAPRSATSASIPTTRVDKASSPLATASRDDNLEKRVEPVEALARRGDARAVQAVMDALHDEDWRVRSRAIDAAVNAYVAIPESALIEHAQSDSSADVRFIALAGIAARIDPVIPQVDAVDPETARAISRQALSDASESVRWQAQQILDTLDSKQQTVANDPPQAEVLL